ncbi:transposase [Streptomyces avermitilis]|uniref:transposase n=1 Tax=Streptomyces avermitilis TaxID=33903 RepID=UPI00372449AF
MQLRVRTEQQTPEWKTRYAVRSGVEGTVNEFAHGYGMRRCRYRGQGKAHIQHVLTAIAVNIERLSGLPPTEEAPTPRRPTAFQNYLDQREIPRPKSWRTWAADLDAPRSPTESNSARRCRRHHVQRLARPAFSPLPSVGNCTKGPAFPSNRQRQSGCQGFRDGEKTFRGAATVLVHDPSDS